MTKMLLRFTTALSADIINIIKRKGWRHMARGYDEILADILKTRLVAILRGVPMDRVEGVVRALIARSSGA